MFIRGKGRSAPPAGFDLSDVVRAYLQMHHVERGDDQGLEGAVIQSVWGARPDSQL